MASTIALSRTIAFAQAYVGVRPILGVGQNATYPNEYGLSAADWVRQFMLAPPFNWRWNRGTTSFTTVAGTQDYAVTVSTFGWLEKAILTNSTIAKELEVFLDLPDEVIKEQPVRISAQTDDGAGSITFRLFPVPEAVYTVKCIFQKAAPQFVDGTSTWTPIPDYFSYLFNQGFLAKVYEQANDERFVLATQLFYRQVIAAHGGLSESQVNIFMDDRINTQREVQAKIGNSQSGRAGRGMFQA